MYKTVIIGGGITGVSVARLLQKKGISNFLVLEKEKVAGGLCRSEKHQGHYLDIGGGHFLCTKYPEVYDFIFEHIAKDEFDYYPRVSKIQIEGHVIDYPVESNIWQLPLEKHTEYLISAIQSGEQLSKLEPKNYEEWIRWKLGEKIAEQYMLPYNKKIWGVEPSEMDIDWLHKIPRLNLNEIVKASLERDSDAKFMPSHSGFYYPKNGGFQLIFDSIYEKVKQQVELNFKITSLERKSDHWLINQKIKAEKIITTAPWPSLQKFLRPNMTLKKHFQNLKHNSIVVSLYEGHYTHDWHWLYQPDMNISHHREFFIKNFSAGSNRNGLYTETNFKRWKKGAVLNGTAPIVEYINEYAYPIPVLGHTISINTILAYYQKKELYGVGRWGQWNYFNSDVCIKEAMKLVDSIF